MKNLLYLLILVFSTSALFGQTIWKDDLDGKLADLYFINSSTNPYNGGSGLINSGGRYIGSNLTASGIGRGSGTVASNAFQAYGASGFNNSNFDTNDYFQFTLTPTGGRHINFSAFSYTSGTGLDLVTVDKFALRSSLDGYAANIGSPTKTGTTISLSAPQFQNITSAITFRLYAWGGGILSGTYWEIQSFNFTGAVTLPVNFGIVEATKTDNLLNIKWTTEKEADNDRFEIQASKDGVEFKTIKSVSSTGSSDQNYEVSIPLSDIASVLGFPAFLALMSIGFRGRKRFYMLLLAVLIGTVSFYSCSKSADALPNQNEKLFIRIKQIDKDGGSSYSKVVAVKNY
ncbi:MAG: hypothetical protein IPH58_05820 [Sphingobacteriales bacterium]|jgi:hypothetical protein|nr:hypothetical protein [Sphingobacteriales bacterium]